MKNLLINLVDKNKKYTEDGQVASYIPALLKANKNNLGICVVDIKNNEEYWAGESDIKFTIQSISKVVSLIIALTDNGREEVLKKVNVEPTGMGFNSIVNLEIRDEKPYNPMINAGAIVTTSLIFGENRERKAERILNFIRRATNNEDININQEIYESEKETGDRNRSLAYFMKSNGILEGNVEEVLDLYFKQCSIEATAKDLARFASVIANDGITPWGDEVLISRDVCRIVKTIMVTCGMYDASGEFAVQVGIPAKSGVGGGILATVPRRFGIGIYGPSLDKKGNSIGGIRVLRELSEELGLSIF